MLCSMGLLGILVVHWRSGLLKCFGTIDYVRGTCKLRGHQFRRYLVPGPVPVTGDHSRVLSASVAYW